MLKQKSRIVIDTNIWISFLLNKDFSSFDKMVSNPNLILLFSDKLLEEFIEVARRPKFKKYFSQSDLEELLKQLNDAQEPGKLGNGVTFYFGEYPENFSPNLNNALYGNCRTLVAIPTYGSELNGSYTDFMNADTVAALKKIIDDGGIKENMPQDGTFSAFNHYKLCPPENNCSTSNVIWENLK